MGSAPVGAQCSLTSSPGEFLGYWDWLGILGPRPCWFPSPLPSPSISRCFPFTLLHFTSHWISFVYFLRWRYLHPTTNPPPYSRLGIGTMVIGYPKRLRYHGGGVRYHGGGLHPRKYISGRDRDFEVSSFI